MSANPTPASRRPHNYFSWMRWIFFLLVVAITPIWMAHKPTQVSVPLLHNKLPAYHIIMQGDIYIGQVDITTLSADTRIIRALQDLIGHYTLTTIFADKPILGDQIGPKPDLRLLLHTLAVAIPANTTTLLGGNLHAGDIVSIASVPLSKATALPRIVFDSVLVLDVKQSPQNQAVIILAIPTYRWPSFLAEMQSATVVLALREEQ
jgi:Flp pilus assembly protein CpaB